MSEPASGQVDAPVPPVDGAEPPVPTDDAAITDGVDGGDLHVDVETGLEGDPPVDSADGVDGGPDGADPVPPGVGTGPVMGDYRMAIVAAVNVDLPNQHPTVVLRESESPRRQLSFSIGFQDAVVLTHAMRRIPTPRPLTHELMSQVLQGFDIDVVAVRLVGRQGAIYFAELDLRGRTGRSVHSCRPSDALTVALLQPVSVPILIDRRLFEVVGDVVPPGPDATR
jgi:bifunctional DNase/RNase